MTLTRGSRSSLRELSLSGLGGLGALPPIEPSAVKVFILSVMMVARMMMTLTMLVIMMGGMVMRNSFGSQSWCAHWYRQCQDFLSSLGFRWKFSCWCLALVLVSFALLIIGDLFPFSKPFNKVNVLKRLTGKLCHRRGPLPKIWFSRNFFWPPSSRGDTALLEDETNLSWQCSQALAQKGRLDAIFDPQTRKDLISRGRNDTCEFCGKVTKRKRRRKFLFLARILPFSGVQEGNDL